VSLRRGHGTLHKQVFEMVAKSLMRGDFRPGDQLSIREIATRLGTSTMPVREAVRRLAALGAIEVHPQKYLRVPQISAESFIEVAEMRKLLEARATFLACRKATDAELREVRAIHAELTNTHGGGDPVRLMQLNQQFHFGLYRLARSELLLETITHLWLLAGPHIAHILDGRAANTRTGGLLTYFSEHDALLRSLDRRDAVGAVTAVVADIELGATVFLESIRASQQAPAALTLVPRRTPSRGGNAHEPAYRTARRSRPKSLRS